MTIGTLTQYEHKIFGPFEFIDWSGWKQISEEVQHCLEDAAF